VLFPVVNEVMIEYTLHWLNAFEVQDIILVYKNRKDKIEQYFEGKGHVRRSKR
jgi:NDP-sugar pyrophosphorylase family protein